MQKPEVIKTGLDYIEQNLKTDIAAEELARMAGYSTYHYYRLFSSVMGSSVANFILKRRLDHALAEIADGRKAIDVTLEYGFDTYAGFYKAFCRMYGCSPKKYLSIYQKHTRIIPEVAGMYTEKELRKVLENWDIAKDLPIGNVYILDGTKIAGNVWKVGGGFVLKTGDREKLLKNLRVVKALNQQGFTSSLPVSTNTGEEYLDGKDIFILSHTLKGSPLSKADRYGSECYSYADEYGSSIARLHNALRAVQNDISPDTVNLYQNVCSWALPNVKMQNQQWSMGIDEKFFDDYIRSFGQLCSSLPKQLIHRDPNPGNILFAGTKVSGFIDFDLSEENVRLWDVCYCATGILSETEDDAEKYEKWLGLLKAILHGYNSISKLTPEEKQSVFYVICSIQMICVAYFESVDEYKQLAKINRRMLEFIIQSKEQIDSIF